MTAETFCTTVVPGIAGVAYLFAGVANLCTKNYTNRPPRQRDVPHPLVAELPPRIDGQAQDPREN